MRDLTQGSIPRQLFALAAPIALGMFFQTLYLLVDLYFVSRLGDAAIAGVSAAGNVHFLVMALTQILGVGTMVLIAQAVGQKDKERARLIFNQSLSLSGLSALATLLVGYASIGLFMRSLGADAATVAEGTDYLIFLMPGLALQFGLVSMSSALRGTGVEKPTMVVQIISVILNAILTPILIAGWWTVPAMGVKGSALASSISVTVGVVILAIYFLRREKYIRPAPELCRPRLESWRRILAIGLPPGGEFALIFVFMSVVYWVIRDFGAAAQAGFGIGGRVMQAFFLPAMAISFATAPIAGQNFGAGQMDRVRATFRTAVIAGSVVMVSVMLLCQLRPEVLIAFFSKEEGVIAVGSEFLRINSLNFIASGLIFTCSGLFQAFGNTLPALKASSTRLLTFAIPAVALSYWTGFELRHLWSLSVASVALQALLILFLLRREARIKLAG